MFALAASLALAAVMTTGDWLWSALHIQHRVAAGVTHGAIMCLCVGLAVGVRTNRLRLAGLGGPLIGAAAAGTFYLLAPVLRWSAMLPAWMLLWLLFALLQLLLARNETLGTTIKRGILAALLSGLAFYLISDIWIHEAAHRSLLVHFGAWAFAFLPGFVALFAAVPAAAEGAVAGCALAMVVARTSIAAPPDHCERLRAMTLPHVAIGATQRVDGTCRVTARLTPTADSDIAIEVWMPEEQWNGKFQGVGNGAWSGSIATPALTAAVRRGYAAASTDTGHSGNSASFALGHPEKLIDFAWRSEHEMTVAARAIVTTFYGHAPRLSYWNGCSAGGRQALEEAQRFPADYDGIVAGSPGLDWSARSGQAVRIAHALSAEGARLTPATLTLLHDAVLRACDAEDGLQDGLIADPSRCRADPAALVCRTPESTNCLTAAQAASATTVYAAAINPAGGREMPGLARGSERGWTELGMTASARATGQDHYRFIVFKDPAWTVEQFDPRADLFRIDEGESALANATDTNLAPFFAHGGKLLQYHGWSDPQISPFSSVAYYQRVLDRLGADRVMASYRLFMAPGMGHCGGGDGPNQFDALAALEAWVEQGRAPDTIEAAHAANGRVDRTRPLCPYPSVARYTGRGSPDAAASFTCAAR
jgi:feruloyl esterase